MPDPLNELAEKDGRFQVQAYLFVYEALRVAQQLFKEERHVTGRQLLEGIKQLARDRYGRMAKTVLASWGVTKTDDFGAIVFNLVGAGMMSKTEEDRVEDFSGVYDFDDVFLDEYRIPDARRDS